MFLLKVMTDNVRVHPIDFDKPSSIAIKDALNRKYANRIIHQVGLGIRVFDIESISDPLVLACQDGSYQCKVTFRIAIFRPVRGEVLVGKIKDGSAQQGIKVSMEFFDDIIIPPNFLMPGTVFDAEEGVWVWKYDGNDLYMVLYLLKQLGSRSRNKVQS
jgi:DNA-directed RNA polymerase III subunit RPC8